MDLSVSTLLSHLLVVLGQLALGRMCSVCEGSPEGITSLSQIVEHQTL